MLKLALFTALSYGAALAYLAPKSKVAGVGAVFAVAPDSTVSATITVRVRGTLKVGDQIRYKVRKDSIDTVFNKVAPPFSLSATGLPAPAYGATSCYTPSARVVYANGTQSGEVAGAPWCYTRPAEPGAEIDSVTITPSEVSLGLGKTQQFTAAVFSH
jgi:hypothetical protein